MFKYLASRYIRSILQDESVTNSKEVDSLALKALLVAVTVRLYTLNSEREAKSTAVMLASSIKRVILPLWSLLHSCLSVFDSAREISHKSRGRLSLAVG